MNNNNEKNSNDHKDTGRNSRPSKIINYLLIFCAIFGFTYLLNYIWDSGSDTNIYETDYTQFRSLVENGFVSKVDIEDYRLTFYLKEGISENEVNSVLNPNELESVPKITLKDAVLFTGRLDDSRLYDFLNEHEVVYGKVIQESPSLTSVIFSWLMPFIILFLVYTFLIRIVMNRAGGDGGGFGAFTGSVSKSKAKVYEVDKNVGITFADVAGQEEAKESLVEIMDYLNNPDKYIKVGAKQPKGALLVGPPGTGKTLLAKALAGEAKVPFYHLIGSEFVELYVGVGASRVRDLFNTASKDAPCIIFIDEIDAIGKSRDNFGNDEREQTLNQLLAEMDGFDNSKGIVVLAATNRPEVLDQALLRAGRFDRRIIVERPDLIGREAILKVHASKVITGSDVNLREIALATSGATGADLANMINEAALRAVRLGRGYVEHSDLMEAMELVIAGKEKKDRILSKKEKELVAYHEVGHALVSAIVKNAQPVQKITIVPRTMGSLGYTMNIPEEERYLHTREELFDEMAILLGGRAAEIVKFSTLTTGASNDIERATEMARNIVTIYGMSDKFGPVGLENVTNKYLNGMKVTSYSDHTGSEIDSEVRIILQNAQQEAVEIITGNIDALDRISGHLMEKENITGAEFTKLLENKDDVISAQESSAAGQDAE